MALNKNERIQNNEVPLPFTKRCGAKYRVVQTAKFFGRDEPMPLQWLCKILRLCKRLGFMGDS